MNWTELDWSELDRDRDEAAAAFADAARIDPTRQRLLNLRRDP